MSIPTIYFGIHTQNSTMLLVSFFLKKTSTKSLPFLREVSKSCLSKSFHQNHEKLKVQNLALNIGSLQLSKSGISSNKCLIFLRRSQTKISGLENKT